MSETTPSNAKRRTWRQRLRRWIVVLCASYLACVLVLMALEHWLVYHPAGVDHWLPPPNGQIQDVEFTTAAGDRIHAWWLPRAGAQGALIYFHGNAGNLSWRGKYIAYLSEQFDVAALIIDYPGYGKSTGAPSESGCYAAADAAHAWLTEHQKISAENVLLYGSSLGGGVAVNLASRKTHRALILVSTFTSLPDVGQNIHPYFPIRLLMRNRFDSLSRLTLCQRPIVVVHGDADGLVPYAQGERLFEAASGLKKFIHVPGGDHGIRLSLEQTAIVKQFLADAAPFAVSAAN